MPVSRPLARGIRHALALLLKGEWRELIVRLRIACGEIDLVHDPTEEVTDRTHYYADSGGQPLDRLLAALPLAPGDAIVDFGCGKGGVLISLSKYPFAKITGVEISPELAAIAERNLRKLNIGNVRIECCDAADFRELDEYNYFYFFDPFPCAVMEAVLNNIEDSISKNRRKVTLIYLNPYCHKTIEMRSSFFKEKELPHFKHECFIYSNVPS